MGKSSASFWGDGDQLESDVRLIFARNQNRQPDYHELCNSSNFDDKLISEAIGRPWLNLWQELNPD